MGLTNYLGEKVAYHKQRSHRIEALADGVFAIVMTLLVLDIRVPTVAINSEGDIWFSVANLMPKIFTFALSFSVAGQLWSIFTNQFNYIHSSDRRENIIALLFLMFVSLLPFSTAFLSAYLWSKVVVGFYLLNILLILTFHLLHWCYCFYTGLVTVEGNDGILIHRAIIRRAKTVFIAYAFVIGFCVFSSYLALGGAMLIHIIATFGGFFEKLFSKRSKKIRSSNPQSHAPLDKAKTPSA